MTLDRLRLQIQQTSHRQGENQFEMKRHETVGERRGTEIKNLAIAKQTKDAECVDLVHHLEGLTADVCQTRE